MSIPNEYSKCSLCNRMCLVDRASGMLGFCSSSAVPHVTRAALHKWEEPIISGTRGSGTIFFSGCSLGCIFCQNYKISRAECGRAVSIAELSDIMLDLKAQGAHNINFVTPTHHSPSVALAIDEARRRGLDLPIVYNTGGYDTPTSLKALEGRVDVFLPDFKYYKPKTAEMYAGVLDYPDRVREAIAEMVRQRPRPRVDDGIMHEGVIVRILLLPAHVAEAKLTLKYLYETYGNNVYISLMSQYTPMEGMMSPLDRRVTNDEYNELVSYAERIGVVNAFIQCRDSSGVEYIPEWFL